MLFYSSCNECNCNLIPIIVLENMLLYRTSLFFFLPFTFTFVPYNCFLYFFQSLLPPLLLLPLIISPLPTITIVVTLTLPLTLMLLQQLPPESQIVAPITTHLRHNYHHPFIVVVIATIVVLVTNQICHHHNHSPHY